MKTSSTQPSFFPPEGYRQLFHLIPEAVFVADVQTETFLDCNAAAEKLTGYKQTEIVGKHITFLCDQDNYQPYTEIFQNHVRQGGGQDFEMRIRHASGQTIPVMIVAARMRHEQGDILVGVFTELSKILDLREKLSLSESRYRHTIDVLTDIIHVIDNDYRIILCNKTAEDYQTRLDLPLPMEGQSLFKVYPFLSDKVRDEYAQVFSTSQVIVTHESHVIRGKDFHTITHKIPLVHNSRVTHVVTVVRDVTRQIEADKAATQRQAMLNSIFRSAPVGIGVVSDRVMTWMNDKFCDMTGYAPEELRGQSSRMVYPSQEEFERVGKIKYEAIQQFGAGAIETQWRHKNGSIMDVWLSSTPIDPDNLSIGVTFTALDITDRKQAERSLKESEERFRLLAENLPGVVYLCKNDEAYTMVFLNDAIKELTGYAPRDFYQKTITFSDICHSDDVEMMRHEINEAVRHRKPFHIIYRLRHRNGDWRWVEEHGVGVFRDDELLVLEGYINDITARKAAERSIQQSESKFRSLYESVQAGVMVLNADGLVTHVNQVACRVFGREAGELCGHASNSSESILVDENLHLIPLEDYPSIITLRTSRPLRNVLCGLKTPHLAQIRWLLINTEPVFDSITHKIREVMVTFVDITRRKEAEESLRRQRDLAQNYLDIAGVLIVALDKQGCITMINRRGCSILESSHDRLIGKNWLDMCIPPEQRDNVKAVFTRLMSGDIKLNEYVENEIITHSGKIRTIAWYNNILRDNDGAINGTLSSGEDITERLAMEEQIRASEQEKTALLDSMVEAVTYQDKEYRIIWANKAAAQACHLPVDEMVGRKCHELWCQSDHPCKDCPLSQVFISHHQEEGEIATPDGKIWLIKVAPIFDEQNNLVGAVETSLDITERKHNEIRLMRYQQQLRDLASELTLTEEAQRQRVATELHDHIGQNLALSILKLEGVRQDMPSGLAQEVGDVCDLVRQAVRDTRNLIFDLGSPTLYTAGFEEAVEDWLAEQLLGVYHIAYQFTDDNQPKPLQEQNKILLFRAVREVLINTIKHAQAKKVTVDICRIDDKIKVTIQDDGIGFNFDKLATPTAPGGHGFGLFSLRERLDHMGGRFDITSSPGQGTKVVLMAPLSPGHEQKDPDK